MATSGDYVCVDTTTDLYSCGGCASIDAGQDCTTIPNVDEVACTKSACVGKQSLSVLNDGLLTVPYYSLVVHKGLQGGLWR